MSGQVVRVFRFPLGSSSATEHDEGTYRLPDGWEPVGAETRENELLIFAVRSTPPSIRVA